MSTRPRQRRTRFISGSTLDETACRTKKIHMGSVNQSKSQCNEQHTSLPSSPNSPFLDSANMLFHNSEIGLNTYVTQKDIPADRSDAVEDENSFASSMFSEKLVQPELNLVAEPSSASEHESLKHKNPPITNKRLLGSHSSTILDAESDVNLDGILMQGERMVLTPTPVAADDAGSSEGEYENESREPSLHQPNSSIHHMANQSGLVSVSCSRTLELLESESQESMYSSSAKVSVFDSISPESKDGGSDRSGNLLTRKPNGFVESPTPSRFVALVNCSPPHQIHSSQKLHKPVDRLQTASCFVKSNKSNVDYCGYSCNDDVISAACNSQCSHRFTDRSYSEKEVEIRQAVSCSTTDQLSQHDFNPALNLGEFSREAQHDEPVINSDSLLSSTSNTNGISNNFLSDRYQFVQKSEAIFTKHISSFTPGNVFIITIPSSPSSENPTTCDRKCDNSEKSTYSNPTPHCINDSHNPEVEGHSYPLRSRLRQAFLRLQWQAMQVAPKSFGQLPTEVVFRIIHYLSIQDVFRLQRVNHRFKAIIEQYLLLVKRINFSNGLPFAFLPESITDVALKRMLSRTPEVTHILGFYPRKIVESYSSDGQYSNIAYGYNSLTYSGIIAAFRLCPKLRSVELMDVELMSELVRHLPRIKFHGMFRNRPDSWDCEYAVPLPPESNVETAIETTDRDSVTNIITPREEIHVDVKCKPLFGNFNSTLFCSATATSAIKNSRGRRRNSTRLKSTGHTGCGCTIPSFHSLNATFSSFKNESQSLTQMAVNSAHKTALRHANFANWFEPVGELPLGQGSPSTVPHFLPSRLFTAFTGGPSFLPAHENMPINPMSSLAQDCYANTVESLRSMAVAHFLRSGLPPIEAELIAVAPFGYSRCSLHGLGSGRNTVRNAHGPVLAFAFGATFVPPQATSSCILPFSNASNCRIFDPRQNNALLLGANLLRGAQGPHLAFERIFNFPQNVNPVNVARQINLQDQAGGGNQQRQQPQRFRRQRSNATSLNASGPWLVSPLPSQLQWIILPHAITNLTKLDLVSVAISAIPRLDNIKYLHLKWVVFASSDPFFSFLAPKLQSFVMNNCSTPSRVVRYVRIFSALSRAPQLARLELVGTRFIDGLIGHIIDDTMSHGRGFRNLQRLVLSSNKDASEVDIGLLLLAGQQSLNQVALQMLHTKNSLFESLYHAGAEFPRLESLTLGYLDPYQSRLTVSELMSLGIGESADHLSPICAITDWGIALAFFICPRLVNITIRSAPYLSNITRWFSAGFCDEDLLHTVPTVLPSSSNVDSVQQNTGGSQEQSTQSGVTDKPSKTHFLPLRSLTLENCPGISVENLERVLNDGHPFPCLETVVLRNMFIPQHGASKSFIPTSHASMDHGTTGTNSMDESIDWRKLSHLLALSDLLAARRIGYSPLSPEGISLGASVREVIHMNPPRGFMPDTLRAKPHDLFCLLRAHTYLNSLLELDGSCGSPMSSPNRILRTLFSDDVHIPTPSNTKTSSENITDKSENFISRSSQTCICGMLEWDVMLRMSQTHLTVDQKSSKSKVIFEENSVNSQSEINQNPVPSSSQSLLRSNSNQNNSNTTTITPQLQLGGSLAFHPFPPSLQHKTLCRVVTASEWTQLFSKMSTPFGLPLCRIVYPVTGADECSGCASDPLLYSQGISNYQISAPSKEPSQVDRASKWLARDACVDTSELRCYSFPIPQILKIYQPLNAVHSCLTSLHFEKVGISHLILHEAAHLKNITLENCTELRAILFDDTTSSCDGDDRSRNEFTDKHTDRFPALRRIRIINCPKFAIYNFLYGVAKLYPAHDENLSITYRPFGQYNTQVERALWNYCQHAHILISHDYKIGESERVMEEFHSTFDQLFREVINFSDMVIRRDLLPVYPQPTEVFHNSVYKRSEHGSGWDLITDIPWVHEVCCSLLRNNELHRSDQADQLYELLSEYQTISDDLKIQRHGIHFHVQFRNVHSFVDIADGSLNMNTNSCDHLPTRKTVSYVNWPYTESYLLATCPSDDLNTMKYILNEGNKYPIHTIQSQNNNSESVHLHPWQRLLLSQEETLETESYSSSRKRKSSLSSSIYDVSKSKQTCSLFLNQQSSLPDTRSKKFHSSSSDNNIPNNHQFFVSSLSSTVSSSSSSPQCNQLVGVLRKRSHPPSIIVSKPCKKFKSKQ